MTQPGETFQWLRHPEAEEFVKALTTGLPTFARLADGLLSHTSTRLVDWLDHVVLADGDRPRRELANLGFEPHAVPVQAGDKVLHHPGAVFPRLILRAGTPAEPGTMLVAAIQVEDIAAFLSAQRLSNPIEGSPLGPFRRALAWQTDSVNVWVVERRGHAGLIPVRMPADYAERYLTAYERWASRPRDWHEPREGMAATLRLAQGLAGELGADMAAWAAFAAERAYWQRRNWAGQVQRARQERLGLGWANHDHHTFRSSRECFPQLVQILTALGFQPRERFYAGSEAGWGAQVLYQPACGLTVFADVDLAPDEAQADLTHRLLEPRPELGTVGLWCALHGESMLSAGLHHLAARCAFAKATADLAQRGVEMMRPFSEFPFLQQAFTRGERWAVPGDRLVALRAAGQIDLAQHQRLADEGAVGSHLENIQRGEGFRGFNQQTVSDIIRRTDPRSEHRAA